MKRNRGEQAKDLRFIWFYPEMSESEVFVQPQKVIRKVIVFERQFSSLTASYFKKIVNFQSHYRISVVRASKMKGWFHCIGLSDGLPKSKHTPQMDHSDFWPKMIKYSQTDIIYTRSSHKCIVTLPLVGQTYNLTTVKKLSWAHFGTL